MPARVADLSTGCAFEIARCLALQVRALTMLQIVNAWRKSFRDVADAEECIAGLARAGLVVRQVVEAHPLLSLSKPLLSWTPGTREPSASDFWAVSELARSRMSKPHEVMEIVIASPRAARLFGAFLRPGRLKHCEISHDLQLSQVFLRYRSLGRADGWAGEAAFPKLGLEIRFAKDPDAFLVAANGMARRVIEFSGNYEADHLIKFHEHCAGAAARRIAAHFGGAGSNNLANLYAPKGTAYELW